MQRAQDRIFKLLDGVDTLEQLDRGQQVELFNFLEEVKAVLVENARDRRICRRERKTGTTLGEVRCETVAEGEKIPQEARAGVCMPQAGTTSCGTQRP